jgi:hypothetical protein
MNEVYKPVTRQLTYITLYGIVQGIVQHQDTEEILSIVDDIRNEADWTMDGDSHNTILLTADVLRGVEKWIDRHPHRVFMRNSYTNALRSYRIADAYLCDIGIASDL